jgi:hypothetical protein
MKLHGFVVLAALLCASAVPFASAEQPQGEQSALVGDAQTAATARDESATLDFPAAAELPPPQACTAEATLCEAWSAYRVSYYRRLEALGEVQVKQFRKQMAYSDWIMFVVLLLVFGGLAFSGAQLWVALKTGRSVTTGDVDAKIGEQIVVKTSAMGISVLTISLIFFYLLLQRVYAIVPVTPGAGS